MEFAPLLAEESGLIQSEVSIVLLLSLAALVAIRGGMRSLSARTSTADDQAGDVEVPVLSIW